MFFLSSTKWFGNKLQNFMFFGSKMGKTHFYPIKPPINPRSHGPIMLVRELVRINVGLHVCTKFHQNRIIFARVIALTDKYIYININIYIYMNLNGWCFWPLGTSKWKKKSVPGPGLTMSTTVIAYSLYGKFAKTLRHTANAESYCSKNSRIERA